MTGLNSGLEVLRHWRIYLSDSTVRRLITIECECDLTPFVTVLQDRQVAVVAGTAADADRVAYVKTVRPSSVDADDRPMSEAQPASHPRYANDVRYDAFVVY